MLSAVYAPGDLFLTPNLRAGDNQIVREEEWVSARGCYYDLFAVFDTLGHGLS